MERFISKDEGSRLYFSYENFMDPISGPGEAVRLANFLAAGLKHDALDWVMNSMEDGGDDGGGTEEHPIDALLRRGGEKGVCFFFARQGKLELNMCYFLIIKHSHLIFRSTILQSPHFKSSFKIILEHVSQLCPKFHSRAPFRILLKFCF